MAVNDLTITLGGEAGQGVDSSGLALSKALVRGGLHIFALQDLHSRIRGGHNFYQIRVADHDIYSHDERVHLLLALTQVAVQEHLGEIVPGGGVIYDPGLPVDETALAARSVRAFPVPLERIAEGEGGSKLMSNTAATAAAAGLIGLDLDLVAGVIRDSLSKKGGSVVDSNLRVASAAYRFVSDKYGRGFPFRVQGVTAAPRMVISGNDALALGVLMAGCKFVAGYPMTPGSPILEWLAAHSKDYGIVIKHAEDEIAAINMIIGAAQMGARALTPTSGGGFSLMVEALGLAGMAEVPIVVVNVQRPGPSTGHATRHEQGDLLFVIYASQGEFPRVVLAPGSIEQCFEVGYRAFNLADKYQCPAIILSDAYLAHSLRALELDALDLNVPIDRGSLLSDTELDTLSGPYKRYALTDSGISPRALPGHPKAVQTICSDEHEEDGHICEDAALRIQMVDKRMHKLEVARAEMQAPLRFGPQQADVTLLTWGSTIGPVRMALDLLNAQARKSRETANAVQIVDMWPLPVDKVRAALQGARKLVCVEQNYSGQLATLLRAYTGIQVDALITKYSGRPMSPEYVATRVSEVA